jgi:hypothetical protein
MKAGEARKLEQEYNDIVVKGRELWEQIEPLGKRCNEILQKLRKAEVEFDEIALIFGGELQIEVYGEDDKEISK